MKATRILLFVAMMLVLSLGSIHTSSQITVQLAWDPSTNPDVTNYIIYQGGVSRIYTNSISAGNVTNFTWTNLTYVPTLIFAATAQAMGLESDYSNEASYTPLPPTPTGLCIIPSQ